MIQKHTKIQIRRCDHELMWTEIVSLRLEDSKLGNGVWVRCLGGWNDGVARRGAGREENEPISIEMLVRISHLGMCDLDNYSDWTHEEYLYLMDCFVFLKISL